ncbi:MAG: hypothetical protein PHD15_02140 [Clostridia bacterium]|nr:hypothetical protein [Clostridia bacterium]MDD4386548.1 hypothetical protein [Clostridia bacterium]
MKKKIKSFFIEKDLKLYLENFNLNYKKYMKNRIMQSIMIIIIVIIFTAVFKSPKILLLSLPLAVLTYKYKYMILVKYKKNQIIMKKRMFPIFVKEILLLVRTNNIYNALKKEVEYTPEPIKTYLVDLVKDIDNDKSKKPFDDFANKMEFEQATLVMSMLYTFNEYALNREHLKSLELLITQLYNNEIEEFIENKKKNLWLYSNYTILTMLAFTFGLGIYMFVEILGKVNLG